MIAAHRSRRLVAAALTAGVLLAASGCGDDASSGEGAAEPPEIEQLRFPRGTSVGDGLGGPVPIAASVRSAARVAGCTVASTASAGADHVEDASYEGQEMPPTSGDHDPVPAEWGVYAEAPPMPRLVHNLEHGGIVVHLGADLTEADRAEVTALWREAPPYVLLTPASSAGVPAAGLIVTSWQRSMTCPSYAPDVRAAIATYRDVYRGRGPEDVQALNPPEGQETPPVPATADRRAVQ